MKLKLTIWGKVTPSRKEELSNKFKDYKPEFVEQNYDGYKVPCLTLSKGAEIMEKSRCDQNLDKLKKTVDNWIKGLIILEEQSLKEKAAIQDTETIEDTTQSKPPNQNKPEPESKIKEYVKFGLMGVGFIVVLVLLLIIIKTLKTKL